MSDGALVGRLDELAEYERALEKLRAGHGGTIALIGEPGAGKTRLVAALVGAARAAGVGTLIVRTPVHGGDGHSLPEALAQARATTGVTIFVDDVHGIAADLAAQLDALVRLAVVDPVLVVLAYRPRQVGCEVGAVLSRAEASGALRHVVLGPLGRAESAILLAGHDDAVRIHTDGGGNPLYMKLLAGEVAEPTGGLVREVAGLGRAALRTAWAAAVLGGQFTVELLTEVCAGDPDATGRAVEALVAADVFRPGQVDALLAFRHPVVAEVMYRHIPIGERWALHRRVANVLDGRGATAVDRAPHVAAAGPAGSKDVDVLLAAAVASLDTGPATALRWADAAGALMSADDPRRFDAEALAARARLLMGEVTKIRDALLAAPARPSAAVGDRTMDTVYAGRALTLLGRYDEAGALLSDGLAGVADDPSPDTAVLLSDLANLLSFSTDFELAAQHATTAAGIARGHGDRLREALALVEQAWAQGCAGEMEAARAVIGTAANLVDTMSDTVITRDLSCLYRLGLTEILLEEPIAAQRYLTRGVELCRRTGQEYMLAAMLETLGEVQLRLGRVAAAVETLDQAVFHASRDDLVPHQSVASGVRGIALYWHGGDDAELLAAAEAIEARCEGLRWDWAVLSRVMAGELTAMAGDPERGTRMLLTLGGGPELPWLATRRVVRTWGSLTEAALAVGEKAAASRYAELAAGHPTIAGSATRRGIARRAQIRVQGTSAAPRNFTETAEAAVADFANVHHWLDVAITELAVGQAFVDGKRPDLAAGHLDRAAEYATYCGSGRLIPLVVAAREQLSRSLAPSWAGGLTTREAEVAELAGSGLTSAEIARRLVLSTRTVDSHLRRVYQKLGVPNRTVLAQRMVGSGHATPVD